MSWHLQFSINEVFTDMQVTYICSHIIALNSVQMTGRMFLFCLAHRMQRQWFLQEEIQILIGQSDHRKVFTFASVPERPCFSYVFLSQTVVSAATLCLFLMCLRVQSVQMVNYLFSFFLLSCLNFILTIILYLIQNENFF